MEANSTPTAPAPTTTSDLGTSGSFRISRLPNDDLAVEFDAGQGTRLRAGGKHDVRGFDLGDVSVVLHRHAARACPASPASHGLHFILAKEKLDAFGVLVDDAVLARQHRGPVQLEFGDLDAELLGVFEGVVDLRVMQQDLRGDAADVQARAAQEAVLLDDQRLQAPLRGADGGHITAGPAADDGQIVGWQEQPPRRAAAQNRFVGKRERRRHRLPSPCRALT